MRYLVRLHGEPLGFVTAPPDDATHELTQWLDLAYQEFAHQIRGHLEADGLQPPEPGQHAPRPAGACARLLKVHGEAQPAAVVVATVGTHPRLRECVAALLAQDYVGQFEVIVVDNRPATGGVDTALAGLWDPRLRVVPEPVPGVSQARNTGAAATTAEIVAFTDDDAVADPHWLSGIVAVFQESPSIAATTGLVIAGSLETEAEIWFEDTLGFSKGFQRLVWNPRDAPAPTHLGVSGAPGLLYPFRATLFGSGNSMAFRRGVFAEVGGFDTRLGPGTPALGGEDLDLYVKIILSGHTLVYEPRTFVRHFHRSATEQLSNQMRDYGLGLTAYLTHEVVVHTRDVLASAVRSAKRGPGAELYPQVSSVPASDANPELSARLWRKNHRGMLRGPGAYLRSLRAHRRYARSK